MTLFRRRKSRLQQVADTARSVQKRLPSTSDLPDISLPDISRPELPSMPSAPSMPSIEVRKRVRRDSRDDSPMLSLAGGLLLGLFVGIIVAVVLISRSEDEESSSGRHTGITLLPQHDGEEEPNRDKSAAVTG